MKNLQILFILLFLSPCMLSQQRLDSLLILLETTQSEDTTKAKLLLAITDQYKNVNPDQGVKTGMSAVALAIKLRNDSLLSDSWNATGSNFLSAGNFDSAYISFNKAYLINDRLNRFNAQSLVLNNIGTYYFYTGDYNLALDYYRQAASYAEKAGNHKQLAACLGNMGIIYTALSDFPQALVYHQKALKIHTDLKIDYAVSNNSINIAMVYRNIGDLPKAIEYAESSLRISRKLGDVHTQASALLLLAEIYYLEGKAEDAIQKCKESTEVIGDIYIPRVIAMKHTTLGRIYTMTLNFPEAFRNFEKGIQLLKEINDINNLCFAYQELGMAYLKAPDHILLNMKISPGSKYSKAIEFQERSLAIAMDIESLDRQATAYDNISKIYEDKGDYPKALNYFKKATVVNDSIFTSTKKLEVARLEMQYDFEKQEALTKAENDKNNALSALRLEKQTMKSRVLMGGSLVLLLSGIGGFISYKRRRDLERKKIETDFKLQVSDTEMKALRAQMNPHFIFNSLNSISDYIGKSDIKKADAYLSKFAKLMRQILENSEMKEVLLADDLLALENYMQLEALRLNDKFSYEINIDPEIDIHNTLIPPLILQPYVENSIWHGIAKKEGRGKISIFISREGEMINCIVEDNGVGRKKALTENPTNESKSLGMQITKSRIEILNKVKKSAAEIRLSDLAEGLRVELKLPYLISF